MIRSITLRHSLRLFGIPLYEARMTIEAQPAPSDSADVSLRHQAFGFLWIRRFRRMLTELGLVDPDADNPVAVYVALDPACEDPCLVAHASIPARMRAASAHRVMALRRDPRVASLGLDPLISVAAA